jgi:hypothetical protein
MILCDCANISSSPSDGMLTGAYWIGLFVPLEPKVQRFNEIVFVAKRMKGSFVTVDVLGVSGKQGIEEFVG